MVLTAFGHAVGTVGRQRNIHRGPQSAMHKMHRCTFYEFIHTSENSGKRIAGLSMSLTLSISLSLSVYVFVCIHIVTQM